MHDDQYQPCRVPPPLQNNMSPEYRVVSLPNAVGQFSSRSTNSGIPTLRGARPPSVNCRTLLRRTACEQQEYSASAPFTKRRLIARGAPAGAFRDDSAGVRVDVHLSEPSICGNDFDLVHPPGSLPLKLDTNIEAGVGIAEGQHVRRLNSISERPLARAFASPSWMRRSARSTATTFPFGLCDRRGVRNRWVNLRDDVVEKLPFRRQSLRRRLVAALVDY